MATYPGTYPQYQQPGPYPQYQQPGPYPQYQQPGPYPQYQQPGTYWGSAPMPTPMQSDFNTRFATLKKLTQDGIVIGLLGVTGNIESRVDIDLMIRWQPDMFNLFALALNEMQMCGEWDITSYYNIASIHGYPKKAWNDVKGKKMGVGGESATERMANESGYCAHALTTFPPWHRMYLVLFEQVLFVRMVDIANKYSDERIRANYIDAAKRWRLPYWDYYRPRREGATFPGIIDKGSQTSAPYDFSLPEIFSHEHLAVKVAPDNVVRLMENPFHHFKFGEWRGNLEPHEWSFLSRKVDAEVEPLLNRERTSRHPRRIGTEVKWDNPDRMNDIINELRMDSNRYMLNMIGQDYYADYDSFSNMNALNHTKKLKEKMQELKPELAKKSIDDEAYAEEYAAAMGKDYVDPRDKHFNASTTVWENAGSLEDYHNLYHLLLGGLDPGAHVSRVPIAAFDPAFWFHHGNLERIFTIWQVAHGGRSEDAPLSGFDPAYNYVKDRQSWFSDPTDADQELLPFKKYGGTFWTAQECRNPTDFGYTYADLKGKRSKRQMRADFDALYRWSVPKRSTDSWLPCPATQQPLDLSKCAIFAKPPQPPTAIRCREVATVDPSDAGGDIWEWSINVKVERLALNGSFSIIYYINDLEHQDFDNKKDIIGPTLTGITYIFAEPVETCPNCKRQMEEGAVIDATVPITSQLMDYITVKQLKSLNPVDVKDFLISRLRWRIRGANGEHHDPRLLSKKKQFRLGVSAAMNHGKPCNNDDPPEIFEFESIIARIIQSAEKGKEDDRKKLSEILSANHLDRLSLS